MYHPSLRSVISCNACDIAMSHASAVVDTFHPQPKHLNVTLLRSASDRQEFDAATHLPIGLPGIKKPATLDESVWHNRRLTIQ